MVLPVPTLRVYKGVGVAIEDYIAIWVGGRGIVLKGKRKVGWLSYRLPAEKELVQKPYQGKSQEVRCQ